MLVGARLKAAGHDLAVQAAAALRMLVRSLALTPVLLLALALVARTELHELGEFGHRELEDLFPAKAEALAAAGHALCCATASAFWERQHRKEVGGRDARVGDRRGQEVALAEGEIGDHVQVFLGFAVRACSCERKYIRDSVPCMWSASYLAQS